MKVFAAVLLALADSCHVIAEPFSGPSPESIPDLEAGQQALKLLCPIAQELEEAKETTTSTKASPLLSTAKSGHQTVLRSRLTSSVCMRAT